MQRRQGVRARSEEEKSSDQDQDDEEIIGVKYGDFVLVACEDRLPFIAFVCEPKAHMCKGTGSVKVMWLYRQDDVDPKALVRECKRLKCQLLDPNREIFWSFHMDECPLESMLRHTRVFVPSKEPEDPDKHVKQDEMLCRFVFDPIKENLSHLNSKHWRSDLQTHIERAKTINKYPYALKSCKAKASILKKPKQHDEPMTSAGGSSELKKSATEDKEVRAKKLANAEKSRKMAENAGRDAKSRAEARMIEEALRASLQESTTGEQGNSSPKVERMKKNQMVGKPEKSKGGITRAVEPPTANQRRKRIIEDSDEELDNFSKPSAKKPKSANSSTTEKQDAVQEKSKGNTKNWSAPDSQGSKPAKPHVCKSEEGDTSQHQMPKTTEVAQKTLGSRISVPIVKLEDGISSSSAVSPMLLHSREKAVRGRPWILAQRLDQGGGGERVSARQGNMVKGLLVEGAWQSNRPQLRSKDVHDSVSEVLEETRGVRMEDMGAVRRSERWQSRGWVCDYQDPSGAGGREEGTRAQRELMEKVRYLGHLIGGEMWRRLRVKEHAVYRLVETLQGMISQSDHLVDFSCGNNRFGTIFCQCFGLSWSSFDEAAPEDSRSFMGKSWLHAGPSDVPRNAIIGVLPPLHKGPIMCDMYMQHALLFQPRLFVLLIPSSSSWCPDKRKYQEVVRKKGFCSEVDFMAEQRSTELHQVRVSLDLLVLRRV